METSSEVKVIWALNGSEQHRLYRLQSFLQGKKRQKQKLEWPDGQDSTRRSTDCERGRGSDYGHLRIQSQPSAAAEGEEDGADSEEQNEKMVVEPEVPSLGPLSSLSIALVGFQREHEVPF